MGSSFVTQATEFFGSAELETVFQDGFSTDSKVQYVDAETLKISVISFDHTKNPTPHFAGYLTYSFLSYQRHMQRQPSTLLSEQTQPREK